mgnify:CR=1 FL=1
MILLDLITDPWFFLYFYNSIYPTHSYNSHSISIFHHLYSIFYTSDILVSCITILISILPSYWILSFHNFFLLNFSQIVLSIYLWISGLLNFGYYLVDADVAILFLILLLYFCCLFSMILRYVNLLFYGFGN